MKKFLSLILIVSVLIVNINVNVSADVPPTYQKTKEYLWQIVQDIGFIGTLPAKGLVALVNEILHSKGITGQDVETEEEALDYAYEGVSINGDGNIVLNDDAKLFINSWINDYVEDNKYYVGYSLDLSRYSKTYWWTSDLENIITLYGDDYYIFAGADGGMYSNWWYYLFDKSKFAPVFRSDIGSDLTARYGIDFYNTKTFDRSAPDGGCFYFKKPASGTIGDMIETTPQLVWSGNKYFQCFVNNYKFVSSEYSIPLQNNYIFVSDGSIEPITIYGTQELLSTYGRGYSPYYYNESVYNDFSSSSGDFTISPDNRNYVTYGDVNTYIDDHHTETGTYPTIPDINIWIEEQPRPSPDPTPVPTSNPDNPSGGGSIVNNNNPVINNNPNININLLPGDGTVSGNGTGGGSGIGNIFGFLSDIGKFLGDLIKNLGQALVDVIKGIGDLLNSIITELPTVFFDFLGAVFNWLPEEWVRLMGLSFACMLIVGVIKIFRR